MHRQVRMTRAALMAAGALLCSTAAFAQDDGLRAGVREDMPELMELYRDLHANPELSFEEDETAAKLAARMREHLKKTGDPRAAGRSPWDGYPYYYKDYWRRAKKKRAE